MIWLHLTFICLTGALVLFADHQAFKWMRGKTPVMNRRLVFSLHYAVALGLACILITGGTLFLRAPAYYFGEPVFLIKMSTIAVLIINSYFLGRNAELATTRTFASVVGGERIAILASGAVSTLGWLVAISSGLILVYW